MELVFAALVLALVACLGVIVKQSLEANDCASQLADVRKAHTDALAHIAELSKAVRIYRENEIARTYGTTQLYDNRENATVSLSTSTLLAPDLKPLAPLKRKPRSTRGKRK